MTTDFIDGDSWRLPAWESHLEYFRRLIDRSGGAVVDEGSVLLWAARHEFRGLVNGAARTDPSARPGQVLRRAAGYFGGLGRGYEISALVGRDDDLVVAAAASGLTIGEPDPIQVLVELPAPAPAATVGIDVRMVEDARGVADVIEVARDAHTVYGFPDDLFPALFNPAEAVLATDIEAVVAYEDGRPLATAQVFLTGVIAYVGWVAVRRDAMRRGLGTLVTRAVVETGFARGARAAALLASPMGAPVYRRMGFADVGQHRGAMFLPS